MEAERQNALCVIPARLESSRLPNKVLLDVHGEPLVVRTMEAALACDRFSMVALVTDSLVVAQAVMRRFYPGGRRSSDMGKVVDVAVIPDEASCGTDRVARYARHLPDDTIVVNLQADEPEVSPEALAALVKLIEDGGQMGTIARNSRCTDEEMDDQGVAKVELGFDIAYAFYRNKDDYAWLSSYPHIGAYAFTNASLKRFAEYGQTPGEITHRLEQLRAFQVRMDVKVALVEHEGRGINTQEDYEGLIRRWPTAESGTSAPAVS